MVARPPKKSGPSLTIPVRIDRWAHVAALIEYFSFFNGKPWLFRGVTNLAHTLVPSVGRNQRKLKPLPGDPDRRIPYSLKDEMAVFTMFRQQARAYINDSYTTLEWLAVAQHYGVPTRLLDWTDSLMAAMWFATLTTRTEGDSRVWFTTQGKVASPGLDPFSVTTPRIYRPPHIAPRIGAQGSVLMICPKPTEAPALKDLGEIIIARAFHFELRKRLNALAFNQRTMFADLSGLGMHLGWLYKNNWLAGYREDST